MDASTEALRLEIELQAIEQIKTQFAELVAERDRYRELILGEAFKDASIQLIRDVVKVEFPLRKGERL